MHLATVLRLAGHILLIAAAVYILLTLFAVWWRRGQRCAASIAAPVTVLKPLCGAEPRLYENLRSFCVQDHPEYQIVFGTREADDAALAVAQRLRTEFPERDIVVVSDPRVYGINLKISNVVNLLPHARHDWFVLADSDIAVQPDYLSRVTAPLAQPAVGLVTCLYRGRAVSGLWSRLGVQFIDEWFRPSICLAHLFGSTRFAFGATLAFRRDTLAAIGGLETIANRVADDYWLGEFIGARGLKTVLSDCEVVTDVVETRFADLVARELRWFRTIRSVRPCSYLFTGVCFTVPVALAGLALSGADSLALTLAAGAIGARLVLFVEARRDESRAQHWLANLASFPLRDCLSLLLWACAFGSGKIHWRGQQMKIDSGVSARISA